MNPSSVNYSFFAPFRFKKIKDSYLITNENGEFLFLNQKEFDQFIKGEITTKDSLYKRLSKKNLILKEINLEKYSQNFFKKKKFLFGGPSLHIVVVTLCCNHKCVYCQASSVAEKDTRFHMNLATAKKVVDFIFESPNKFVAIEFQGGEPLLNWEVVKFITEYAIEKNKYENKNLEMRLVSNFTLMDEKKLTYCFSHKISLCTSLDGPEKVHNQNRKLIGGNSYSFTVKWLKKALKKYSELEKKNQYKYQPSALVTITQFSLNYPKEIVNEYLKLGLETIFLRPLSPIGMAAKNWERIGYSSQDYLSFYKKALEYIIFLNLKKGKKIQERMASILLAKILTGEDPNFLDLRSPCGAVIGQVAYDYNGDIYPCDEARMVGRLGDFIFKLGNVFENDFPSVINCQTTKALCLASEITSLPKCTHCVYAPYCGVCPVYNYVVEGNIFSKNPNNQRCQIFSGLFEILFEYLASNNYEVKQLFKSWAEKEIKKEKKFKIT